MPEAEDDVAPLPEEPLMGEASVELGGEADAASQPLDDGGGHPGDDGARRGRLPDPAMVVWGRRVRRTGIAGFTINAAGFGGVAAGVVHEYPYIPVALGFALASWVGRVMIVRSRQAVNLDEIDSGADEPARG